MIARFKSWYNRQLLRGEFKHPLRVEFKRRDIGAYVLDSLCSYTTAKNGVFGERQRVFFIPERLYTDFASVPRICWAVVCPIGRHTRSAVLHDYLYASQVVTRKEADDIFFEAMVTDGCTAFEIIVMWGAVRLFGWSAWNKHTKRKSEMGEVKI